MIDRNSVSGMIRRFDPASDGEALKSRELALQLLECSPAPFSRAQFTPGHITCTGLVLGPDGESLLLVHHRRLGRWLLPGGHIEPEDAEIWEAARREVAEETGVSVAPDGTPPLGGVDVHGIPAGRSEPYHLHHDLVFAFRGAGWDCRVSHESREVAWCAPSALGRYDLPPSICRAYARVRELLSDG
ncbi:MAG TPA: NUDIX domain-containing protein [Bryobacteraceae bacterium]|nr:NUDIX domain-containing protein [Bryobacteraceae bacterium]